MQADTSGSKADHVSVAVDEALSGGAGNRRQGRSAASKDLSQPLIVGTMPAIPEVSTGREGHQTTVSPCTHNTFGVAGAAAHAPPRRPVAVRVLYVLLQLVLLGGYTVLCLYLGVMIILSHWSLDEHNVGPPLSPARWRFVTACGVLVGIIGPVVAGLCFLWGVATAIWQKLPRPRWMRYTLGTMPALAHGVFVLMPFTVAVMETLKHYRDARRELYQ